MSKFSNDCGESSRALLRYLSGERNRIRNCGKSMEPNQRGTPKQVIVMRRDLGMRRGKEIAQGAHASMIWLALRIRQPGYRLHRGRTPLARRAVHQGLRPGGLGGGAAGDRAEGPGGGRAGPALRRCGPDRVPRRPDADLLRRRAGLPRSGSTRSPGTSSCSDGMRSVSASARLSRLVSRIVIDLRARMRLAVSNFVFCFRWI